MVSFSVSLRDSGWRKLKIVAITAAIAISHSLGCSFFSLV